MSRFAQGLVLGLLLGSGGTWAAMARPWAAPSGELLADAGFDAGPASAPGKDRKRKKRRRTKGAQAGNDQAPEAPIELSAAERQSVWRGPAVSLPPRSVDFEGTSGRPLNHGEIQAGLASSEAGASRCIAQARGAAELKATIDIEMLVGPDGTVSKARVKAPRYLHDHGLYDCLRGVVGRIRFDATGAHTVVSLPIRLD